MSNYSNIKIYHSRLNLNEYILPERCGAYIITHTTDNHVEKYVGSTENLKKRMIGHYNKDIMYIDILITDDVQLAYSLEKILIHTLRPITNSKTYKLNDNDEEIADKLIKEGLIEQLDDKEFKIGYRYLKYIITKEKMHKETDSTTTIILDDDVHILVDKKRIEFKEKGIKATLKEITTEAIIKGLPLVDLKN
ncbi:MAG: GIY-YIG nuclease family protein [Candidatus Dojkabacteria bacterium]|nr:GIY-YIG nuclease family protein [Candidatus Dojkabacteria bacterium]